MRDIKPKIKRQINELGLLDTIGLISRRLYSGSLTWLNTRILRLRWHLFQLEHKDYQSEVRFESYYKTAEEFMRLIFSQSKGQSFLEIGIGRMPNIERLRLISENNMRYTGCDFEDVCGTHERIIKKNKDIAFDKMRFFGNHVGTYSWTLFELLRRDEKFDIIYLDGHHTFYIDCPAVVLAHFLLKPGGVFLLDDIEWTLQFMKKYLATHLGEWNFYRKMYNFSQYDEAQQSLPHIRMMAETILLNRLGYAKIEEYSTPGWWALRKPFA